MTTDRPPLFRPAETLRTISEVAVGLGLASAAAGIMGPLLYRSAAFASGLTIALPTFITGLIWARFVWKPVARGKARMTAIWMKSAMLASINAGVTCGLIVVNDGPTRMIEVTLQRLAMGFLAGATAGAIFWIPALIVTMLCLGFPLSRAARARAEQGIAGDEKAASILGISAAIAAAVGLYSIVGTHRAEPMPLLLEIGRVVLWATSLGGLGTGLVTALAGHLRTQRRERFMQEAAAGHITGYRVAEEPEGRVLVRVTTTGGAYRDTEIEEEVYAEARYLPPVPARDRSSR